MIGTDHRARRILLAALLLGVLGDLVFRAGPPGLGVSAWIAGCALAAIVVAGAPSKPLALAAAFGAMIVWRASPLLQSLCAAGAVVAWTVALLDRPTRAGVVSLAMATFSTAASTVLGSPLVLAHARSSERSVPWGALRVAFGGAVVAAPLLLLFGTLFAAADPLFARYTNDVAAALDDVLERMGTITALAWVMGGMLAALLLARFPAEVELERPREGIADGVAVALALVLALFAAFLAVQGRALLGGAQWVEARVGLTYAEYARGGFFRLLACAGIALPLVLAAEWSVAPGYPRRRRTAFLCTALVVAVLAVLVSAARRMALYVGAYGLTELRLYAFASMLWLAIAFLALAVAALRGSRARFCFHALISGGAILVGLVLLDPSARIAAFNASHASESGVPFDARYAVSLGADAVPALLEALPSLPPDARCAMAQELLAGKPPRADRDWLTLHVARERAGTRLEAAEDRLRVAAAACDPVIASSVWHRARPRPPSPG